MCPGAPTGAFAKRRSAREAGQSRGQNLAGPPRLCTATPATANRRDTIPGAPADCKPDAHRAAAAADAGRPRRSSQPAPAAPDTMAAGTRTACGRVVRTVSTFTCGSSPGHVTYTAGRTHLPVARVRGRGRRGVSVAGVVLPARDWLENQTPGSHVHWFSLVSRRWCRRSAR
jgi:hypothetical protein